MEDRKKQAAAVVMAKTLAMITVITSLPIPIYAQEVETVQITAEEETLSVPARKTVKNAENDEDPTKAGWWASALAISGGALGALMRKKIRKK